MATSFGALCTDFYINHKLALKMDLPSERETILHFFDRMRKSLPSMNRFKRYEGELALESARKDARYKWLALRRNSIRTGTVNPESMEDAVAYHKLVLELAPYHLTISPLDVDYVELMYGFDLECKQNHDAVVYEALYANTPLGGLLNASVPSPRAADADDENGEDGPPEEHAGGGGILDVQPVFGQSLNDTGDLQAYYEVKTRPKSRRGSSKRYSGEPISLFLTIRKYGPVDDLADMATTVETLNHYAEELATAKLIPDLLTPITQHIGSSA
ncbi:MAG: hypothetical protein AAGJ38_09760 [Planctomycetota bacterium]